jgi:hypothetical protein
MDVYRIEFFVDIDPFYLVIASREAWPSKVEFAEPDCHLFGPFAVAYTQRQIGR